MKRHVRVLGVIGLLWVLTAGGAYAAAETDFVGSATAIEYATLSFGGNVFAVNESRVMTNFRQQVDPPGAQTVTLAVYVESSGAFELYWQKDVAVSSPGAQWVNAGDIVVPLQAGRRYAMGLYSDEVDFLAAPAFSVQPVSFGAVESNFKTLGLPSSFELEAVAGKGAFAQRMTTDPDASTLADADNDGVSDLIEALGPQDPDADGLANAEDTDSDGDGIPDGDEGTADVDGDGIPNFLDADADGDGIFDKDDAETPGLPAPCALFAGIAVLSTAFLRRRFSAFVS